MHWTLILYCLVLYCLALFCVVLYCIVLPSSVRIGNNKFIRIALYFVVRYYTALHYIMMFRNSIIFWSYFEEFLDFCMIYFMRPYLFYNRIFITWNVSQLLSLFLECWRAFWSAVTVPSERCGSRRTQWVGRSGAHHVRTLHFYVLIVVLCIVVLCSVVLCDIVLNCVLYIITYSTLNISFTYCISPSTVLTLSAVLITYVQYTGRGVYERS